MKLLTEFLREKHDQRNPEDIQAKEFDQYIYEFILSVKLKDGKDFEPSTLRGLFLSFNRHLKECKYPVSVIEDVVFDRARKYLEAKNKQLKLKEGKGNKLNALRFLPLFNPNLDFLQAVKLRNLAIICCTTEQVRGMGLFLGGRHRLICVHVYKEALNNNEINIFYEKKKPPGNFKRRRLIDFGSSGHCILVYKDVESIGKCAGETFSSWKMQMVQIYRAKEILLLFSTSRDYDLREHIPVPYDNLFQSILSFASRCQSYF